MILVNAKPSEGGAARAAFRLYRALEEQKRFDLAWMSERANPALADGLFPGAANGLRQTVSRDFARFRRKFLKQVLYPERSRPDQAFDFGTAFAQDKVRQAIPACDLVNLHWVTGLVDPATIAWIASNRAPVVWTLHDMAPLTGGCHYDGHCGRFIQSCHDCPQLRRTPGFDYAARYHDRKWIEFRNIPTDRLHVVAPSNWLASEARRSRLFRDRTIHVIPNSVDVETFRPRPKPEARRRCGLPDDRPIVLFIADNLASQRKGGHLLAPILLRIRHAMPSAMFISVGSGPNVLGADCDLANFGQVRDEDRLADIYASADMTLLPSLQDNLPNTMIESMACGVPVAAFDVGGIPDFVIDGQTGVLAARHQVGDLANGIVTFLRDADLYRSSTLACRAIAIERCSPKQQSQRYSDLYDQILDLPPGNRDAGGWPVRGRDTA